MTAPAKQAPANEPPHNIEVEQALLGFICVHDIMVSYARAVSRDMARRMGVPLAEIFRHRPVVSHAMLARRVKIVDALAGRGVKPSAIAVAVGTSYSSVRSLQSPAHLRRRLANRAADAAALRVAAIAVGEGAE